jgi:hypothetical protein
MTDIMPSDIPSAHFVLKRDYHPHWIVLTAHRSGSKEAVAVEMNLDQWIKLPPVRYAVKLELSGRKPRQPAAVVRDPPVALPVPRGHIESREGQDWVVVTACRAGSEEVVSVEMTLAQWVALKPIRYAVMSQMERCEERQLRLKGSL